MALNPDDPTVRFATFGKQVEIFLESDIGTFLVNKAKAESEEGLRDLREVDPFDGPKVAKAQMKVKVSEAVILWLGEAIAAGHSATELLKEEHEHQN